MQPKPEQIGEAQNSTVVAVKVKPQQIVDAQNIGAIEPTPKGSIGEEVKNIAGS
jgi:hypothetical protein